MLASLLIYLFIYLFIHLFTYLLIVCVMDQCECGHSTATKSSALTVHAKTTVHNQKMREKA